MSATIREALMELITASRNESEALQHITWRTSSKTNGSPFYKGPHRPAPFPYVTYDVTPGEKTDRVGSKHAPSDEEYQVLVQLWALREDDFYTVQRMTDPVLVGSLFHWLDQASSNPEAFINGPKFKADEWDRVTPYDLTEDDTLSPEAKRVWIGQATYNLVVTTFS